MKEIYAISNSGHDHHEIEEPFYLDYEEAKVALEKAVDLARDNDRKRGDKDTWAKVDNNSWKGGCTWICIDTYELK